MTEGNNIAYAFDCVFVAHYNGIGNIVQSIMGACHEYIMADIISITRNSIAKTDNISINLVRHCIHATNNANSTGILLNRNATKIEATTGHIFISVGYSVAGTLNSNAIRVLNFICRTKNTICYA